MPQTEPLIHWPEPILELLGFLAAFLAYGAIGFRFAVLRGLDRARAGEDRAVFDRAARGAALLGLIGVLVAGALLALALPDLAARHHEGALRLVTTDPMTGLEVGLMAVALAGFALALARRPLGWGLAAVGVVAGALRAVFFGQWVRLVNPVHMLAGGLWIGTLAMLVIVGLPAALGLATTSERRGALAAAMVHAFSPFALTCAGVLATFGAITAWRHLEGLSSLWTTPYGYTLDLKLCAVLVVLSMGAFNWRRQRPRLGSEAGARALQGTATSELIAALVVLVITAVLVSLPSPRG